MAEDWDKLDADIGKLQSKLKSWSFDGANKLWKALEARDKLLDLHEKALEKSALAAFENGVVGKTVADFLKDKGFADAKKALEADRKALVTELKELHDYCMTCDGHSDTADKLSDTAAKALKAAKVGSPAQRKVAKSREELTVKIKDLNDAAALRFKPDKYMTTFNAQFDKLIEHFLAEALKKAKPAKDDGETPQPLAAAKTKKRIQDLTEIDKRIDKLCKDALAAAADKNPAKAMKLLETAEFQLSAMQKIYGEFGKLVTKFKKEIAASKDQDSVKKAGLDIKKLADGAKAACTTTKKKIEDQFADEADPEDYLGLGKLFKD